VTEHPYLPVFVIADDTGSAGMTSAELLRTELGRIPGWVAPAGIDLPSRIARLLWGHEAGLGEAGVSALVDRERLMQALRALADQLVAASFRTAPTAFVDVVGDGRLLGPYLRSVWQDAVVVAIVSDAASDHVAATAPDLVVTDTQVAADPAEVAQRVVLLSGRVTQPSGRAHVIRRRPGAARFRAADSPLRDGLVVVLGAARSGTTWLHRLLCANPLVAGTETGETWLFPDVAPVWADPIRAMAGDGGTLSAMRAFCDELLLALRDRVAPDATHVCEKTPTTAWQLPVLARLYPDAHYVHIVRDGRDAALSMALTRGDGADLGVAAQEWVAAVSAIRAAAGELPRLTEVRYEDLLADPEAVAARLWSWIGVPASGQAMVSLRQRADERVTPLPASGEIGVGKWRSLPPAEQELLEAVAGSLLGELGYDRARP
jgi:hypothetical protein